MNSRTRPTQIPLGVQLREGLTFESFHPGPNAEIIAVLRMLATPSGPPGAFVAGSPGTGKTHLLQALCREASRTGIRAAYLPLADLLAHGPTVIEGMAAFDLLCLDDIQSVAGRHDWETVLVALWDGMHHHGGRLAAVSREPVERLPLKLADLRSRLNWEPAYVLRGLSDDDRLAVLKLRAGARGLRLEDGAARYLLTRCNRELPALMELLDQLDHASLAEQRRLTIPFLRQVLRSVDN